MHEKFTFGAADSSCRIGPEEAIMVCSDLHVGDKNKHAYEGYSDTDIRTMLVKAMSLCDRLVLNGDIVELLNPKNPETAVSDALEFLEGLCEEAEARGCCIEFLFGNHEYGVDRTALCHEEGITHIKDVNVEQLSHEIPEEFIRGLLEIQAEYPHTFHLHPVAFRFGSEKESVLVWHGDHQTRDYQQVELSERNVRTSQRWRHSGYNTGHERFYRLRAQLETILGASDAAEMLDAQSSGAMLGPVTRICFGHTHDPFVGARLDAHTFPRQPTNGMERSTFAARLRLVYDNPGTAQEGQKRCFPVLYTMEAGGKMKAEQYRPRIDEGLCSFEAIDPARTKARHWEVGK